MPHVAFYLLCMVAWRVTLAFMSKQSSPAEEAFVSGLVRAGWFSPLPANDDFDRVSDDPFSWSHHSFPTVFAFPQMQLYPMLRLHHRADFYFHDFKAKKSMIVEVDGDKWHAGKAAHDRYIDRRVQLAGWSVYRFPARETLNSSHCDEAVSFIHTQIRLWGVTVAA